MNTRGWFALALGAFATIAVACAPTSTPTPDYVAELVRTVERDSIQALLGSAIAWAPEADEDFDSTEPVLVASVNGEERAYSVAQLGIHEVVNDTLGGAPIAVTW
jgi:hypothetical protein